LKAATEVEDIFLKLSIQQQNKRKGKKEMSSDFISLLASLQEEKNAAHLD